jgi:ketosteroid isomerase-like protein
VDAINGHDVPRMIELMTEDHVFVDSVGARFEGIDVLRRAWVEYLKLMPDYRVHIEHEFVSGERAALIGRAEGTYTRDGTTKPANQWAIPAAWLCTVRGGQVAEWRVFADNDAVRRIVAREGGASG